MRDAAEQLTLFDLDTWCGKTYPELSPPQAAKTSGLSWRKSSELKTAPVQCLDLTPGHGNLLGQSYWEINSAWLGEYWMLNTGVSPSEERESSLSQILQDDPPSKYYLSRTACLGILRRAEARSKALPPQLREALMIQAEQSPSDSADTAEIWAAAPDAKFCTSTAFATNQRDEVWKLRDIAASLTAGFSAEAGVMAGSICLNDQGGERMDLTQNKTSTLRAQMGGHQPLIMNEQPEKTPSLFENHGIDSRYTGPHAVAPTMSARYGTGGNNVPLVTQNATICIDRDGPECQQANQHTMFSRQRVDVFRGDSIASTQSARQHKDATDLVVDPAASPGNVLMPEKEAAHLIRRLTPLECERLQGFPDGWTDLPGASDSARYKALGNSVAIPCVDFVLRGIAWAINNPADIDEKERQSWNK